MVEEKVININVLKHEGSDLLIAISDDLRGLVVHGRSTAELEGRISPAIREVLEAQGYTVLDVEKVDADDTLPAGFVPPRLRARARLAA